VLLPFTTVGKEEKWLTSSDSHHVDKAH